MMTRAVIRHIRNEIVYEWTSRQVKIWLIAKDTMTHWTYVFSHPGLYYWAEKTSLLPGFSRGSEREKTLFFVFSSAYFFSFFMWLKGNVTSCLLYMLTWMNLSQFKVLSDYFAINGRCRAPALTFLSIPLHFCLLEKTDIKMIYIT